LYSWIYQTQRDCVSFLKNNVKKDDVVITHYLPHYDCIPKKYIGNANNKFFFNHNCHAVVEENNPKLWVYGHTHESMDFELPNKTRLICNPKGYNPKIYGGELNPNFIKDLIIHI